MATGQGGPTAPSQVCERADMVRRRLESEAPEVKENYAFARGSHFAYVSDGQLRFSPTQTTFVGPGRWKGKPPNRRRYVRNLIFDFVLRDVALMSSRIPSYEVAPSTNDPEDIQAGSMSEKVLLAGYDRWGVKVAFKKLGYHAIVGDEGFIWPYFDELTKEIRYRVYSKLEVGWEDGVRFEDARWYVIQQARPIDQVKQEPGFLGGELKADAQLVTLNQRGKKEHLALVTDYLERPTPQNLKGRWLTLAQDNLIFDPKSYPCEDGRGEVKDEAVLHKLSYYIDASSDRDYGLVRQLKDPQRTYRDMVNRLIEWVQLALNPQMIGPKNALEERQQLDDTPGRYIGYRVTGGQGPQWRDTPPIPKELFEMASQAKADMQTIAAQNDIPPGVEAGKAIQLFTERDTSRRGDFLDQVASVYASVARHSLYLVQRFYTDPQLLQIQGRFGFDPLADFRGADIRNQTDVRVSAGSLEPRTRAGIEQQAMTLFQIGAISPFEAMVAIKGGTTEGFADSYRRDVARASRIINWIREGSFLAQPPRPVFIGEEHIDLETGQPARNVPGWMPYPFDNPTTQKPVFEDWMKSIEFANLPPEGQEAANLYYNALLNLEAQKAARDAAQQEKMAQGLGMSNASAPQTPPALPSMPKPQQ